MQYFNNIYGVLVLVGLIAIAVVVVLYLVQKRKERHTVRGDVLKPSAEVAERADSLVALNAESLRAYLSPLRNNQPVFIHNVANLLERAKKASEIKVIRIVIAQLEVQRDLLDRIDEYEEKFHTLNRKQEDFKQRDELQDLSHERDKKRLLREIEALAGNGGTIENARDRELAEIEASVTHEHRIQALKDYIEAKFVEEKRILKYKELDSLRATFDGQVQAINGNPNLSPAAKKESIRTLEELFMKQLDEFRRSL
jgi:FtsZ-interacting cell division protein ZipA